MNENKITELQAMENEPFVLSFPKTETNLDKLSKRSAEIDLALLQEIADMTVKVINEQLNLSLIYSKPDVSGNIVINLPKPLEAIVLEPKDDGRIYFHASEARKVHAIPLRSALYIRINLNIALTDIIPKFKQKLGI